jgi:hypothetical protein
MIPFCFTGKTKVMHLHIDVLHKHLENECYSVPRTQRGPLKERLGDKGRGPLFYSFTDKFVTMSIN